MNGAVCECGSCIYCSTNIRSQQTNLTFKTRLDQIGSNLDRFITEVHTNSICQPNLISPTKTNANFQRRSLRSSKSSQNIQQYQRQSNHKQQLDYYQQLLLNNSYNHVNENELYYSFLRLYVDSLAGYTDKEIWHMVNRHNPRIKQYDKGVIIRLPSDIWFILVTGSLFINGKLYLPHSIFGQNKFDNHSSTQMQKNNSALLNTNGGGSKSTECLTLESSELLLLNNHCDVFSAIDHSINSNHLHYLNHHTLNNNLRNYQFNHQPPPPPPPSHQLRTNVTSQQSQSILNNHFNTTAAMHSSTVGHHHPTQPTTHCPLNQQDQQNLILNGGYSNSYSNLLNNFNNSYLNYQQNGLIPYNIQNMLNITPHQRAASMYSCHSDTTTATNTTSSDSELDLTGALTELVDDEDDDINEEDIRKLMINTDELFSNHHHLNLNNNNSNLSSRLLNLKQVLEKNSLDRTDSDNETILNYINSLSAFDKYDQSIKKQLASVMILAIIESPFTVILTHNETLDSFCCLIHGAVEHIYLNDEIIDQQKRNSTSKIQTSKVLQPGDAFGITEPSMDNLYFKGIMKTLIADCWFLCVTQHDFYKILSETQMEIVKHEENGKVTLVTECKKLDSKKEKVIIRGTPEKLLTCVLDNHADQHFIEDFLLTYRVFMPENKLISIENDCLNNGENDNQDTRLEKLNPVKSNPNAKFRHLVKGFEYIANKLLQWFEDNNLRDKIIRIVLMWINNYYLDFDLLSIMDNNQSAFNTLSSGQQFLDLFEHKLSTNLSLLTQLKLLHIGLSTKAKVRPINLTKNNDVLNFTILGGYERGYGIFVSKVEPNSKVEQLGLRKGDQILEVNGINFAIITHTKALDVLRSQSHLQLTVKYNPFMFHEMINVPEGGKAKKPTSLSSAMLQLPNASVSNIAFRKNSSGSAGSNTPTSSNLSSIVNSNGGKWQFNNSNVTGSGTKFKKAIPKLANFISKRLNFTNEDSSYQNDEIDFAKPLAHRSHSNPDLHKLNKENQCQCSSLVSNSNQQSHELSHQPLIQAQQQNVIRVFNATTGDFRYLFIHPETTAKEVVMVTVGEFGLCNQSKSNNEQIKSSLNYSLYEVSIVPEANNTIKQKRLPDQLNNLCERASIHSRYYIKENTLFSSSSSSNQSNSSSNPNQLTDEVSSEILKECPMPITLLSLKAPQIGIELTLTDFDIFSSIEPQEYIFDIFEMKSDHLSEGKLMEFEALSNKEMFWVINEIVNETNLVKRVKIIKYFIKTANICRNLNNYNSMFAILSGLCHTAVRRLKTTWEKLNTKYHKILKALQLVVDPSRNMVHYRRELSSRISPIIPLYPIVKKDLTFINLAHMTIADDGLVNFDKMRMISKEIRSIMNMSSQPYLMPSVANLTTNALNNTQLSSNSDQLSQSSSSNCSNKNCTLSSNKQQNQRGLLINLQAKISEITGGLPSPAPPPTVVSSNVVAARRIFEENFMKKKVRNYLELCFARISYDEEYLVSKSNEIEPSSNPTTSSLNQSIHSQSNASIKSQSKDQLSINTGSTTTVNSSSTNGTTTNKLQGSPTLSSTSSGSSSCRLKLTFGAESPHQLRKLMSLREDDTGKSTKSNHSLSSFLNYNNHHPQQQNNNNHLNNHQLNTNSLNNGRFNIPNHNLNSNQQFNNNLNQHQLNNNNFTHSQSSSHLRNTTDSLNASNNILMNTVSFNAPLSYESSSVTSLRHLEQLQEFQKFRKQYFNNPGSSFINQQHYQINPQSNSNQQQLQSPVSRPPLPEYKEAVARKNLANYSTIGRNNNLSNNQSNVNRNRNNQDQDKVSAV